MRVSAYGGRSASLMTLLVAGFGSAGFTHSAFGQADPAIIEELQQEIMALEARVAALEEGAGAGEGSTISGSIVRLDCSAGVGVCNEVPLEGALVAVQGTEVIAVTNVQGFYQLTGVPRGVWTVAVTAPASAISSSSSLEGCVVWGIEPNVETSGDPAEIVMLDPMRPAFVNSCIDFSP